METIKIINKYYDQITEEIQAILQNKDPKYVFKKEISTTSG
jgi:hypothetical protein